MRQVFFIVLCFFLASGAVSAAFADDVTEGRDPEARALLSRHMFSEEALKREPVCGIISLVGKWYVLLHYYVAGTGSAMKLMGPLNDKDRRGRKITPSMDPGSEFDKLVMAWAKVNDPAYYQRRLSWNNPIVASSGAGMSAYAALGLSETAQRMQQEMLDRMQKQMATIEIELMNGNVLRIEQMHAFIIMDGVQRPASDGRYTLSNGDVIEVYRRVVAGGMPEPDTPGVRLYIEGRRLEAVPVAKK
jgi:hypothetical protein